MKRALELMPGSDEGYRRLGHVYREADLKEEAIAAYQKAVDINPYLLVQRRFICFIAASES